MRGLKCDGCWNAQKSSDISRALPLQTALQQRAAGVGVKPRMPCDAGVVAPTDNAGVDHGMVFGPDVQEGRPFGRAEPFMAVASVEICAQLVQIQRDVAWHMGAVGKVQQLEKSAQW